MISAHRLLPVCLALAFAACGEPAAPDLPAPGEPELGAAEAGDADAGMERLAALTARMDALDAEVTHAEDVSAIRTLMRTYSFYLDRGLWADLTELMTDDARGSYPAGVFIGKESLAPHFMDNNGRGYLGFEEGRLGNHIALQPFITVHEDGRTAEGRWRVLAQLGQMGAMAAWAGGLYEIDYRKGDDGLWRISDLRYYSGGPNGSFEDGWSAPPRPAERPGAERFRNLPQPPDEPAETDCQGYPNGTCVPPFHYPNPGTGEPWAGLDAPVQETAQ